MTYSPDDLAAIRDYLIATLDLQPGTARGVDLEPNEVGISGDPAHATSGGYHEGNDDLARVGRLTTDYSKRESPRDRPGSNAASALDIGDFNARGHTLRSVSLAIVDACQRGDPRTRDIREIIYTPDGVNVHRWDRLGIRTTGDASHLWHTHLSLHRDAEGRRADDNNLGGLLKEIIEGSGDMASADAVWLGGLVNEANWKLDAIVKQVALIAAKVDIDPGELAAIEAAAKAGAAEGAAAGADALAAKIVAALPADLAAREADAVKAAVRSVFAAAATA